MRSSLGKLRKFALHKSDMKQNRGHQTSSNANELAQATEDMQNMRNCYDSLLAAAAETANSAHEFSESLREMGCCLQEKTALSDDERTGGILSMLGDVQLELQKLVDSYRAHIFMTITTPSESLLNELRTVEEMKRQCDEKRSVYEYMAQLRDKGRLKSGKGESFTAQQLEAAYNEYDDEATLCVFRLKSLKRGQSRSLLTQAARHHAAQLNFFRKGLKSLESVEPHVRMATQQYHIDYQFDGLGADDGGGNCDGDNDLDNSVDGELSFEYKGNKQGFDAYPAPKVLMELEHSDVTFRQAPMVEDAEVNLDKKHGELHVFSREPKVGSHSAPIFADKMIDPAERVRHVEPLSARKFHTYVLPTPDGVKSSAPARTSSSVPRIRPVDHSGHTHNLWHSTPLEPNRPDKDSGDDNSPRLPLLRGQSGGKDTNSTHASIQMPPPLSEAFQFSQLDSQSLSGSKKTKRHAFSSPLTSKPLSAKPIVSSSGPIASAELPQMFPRVPLQSSTSPKVSPCPSPPPVRSPPPASPPRISELHELPRPPSTSSTKVAKFSNSNGHSAPLGYKNQDTSATYRVSPILTNAASPLPTPPLTVQRSFSIPSRSQRAQTLQVARLLESPQTMHKYEGIASPPLTPIFLKNIILEPATPEYDSNQTRGGS